MNGVPAAAQFYPNNKVPVVVAAFCDTTVHLTGRKFE
jgi:hypothetical protein